MKLHFLGTTGYHPNNLRQTACLMFPEIGLIFDAGTGIFRARDLIQTPTLDIVLSHVHLDHCVGLTFLYDILYEKDVKVTVHVEESKIDVIQNHLYQPQLFPVKPNFEMQPLKPEMKMPYGTIHSFELGYHPGGSHGFRLDLGDRTLAYATDTYASEAPEYLKDIRGVDTLIHECYFPDSLDEMAKVTGHSCLGPVVRLAAAAEVKQLYLVHINPLDPTAASLDLESAKKIFGNTIVTEDEMVVEI